MSDFQVRPRPTVCANGHDLNETGYLVFNQFRCRICSSKKATVAQMCATAARKAKEL